MSETDQSAEASAGSTDEVARTRAFLEGALERMGLSLDLDIQPDGRVIRVRLSGDAAAELVSGRGAAAKSGVLEALQTVTSRAVDVGESRSIVIDAADYRDRRIAVLGGAAERLAQLAVERHLSARVYGMNSFDRRGVHVALAERRDVRTDSEGEGVFRTLVVAAAAPPEPAEAEASEGEEGAP